MSKYIFNTRPNGYFRGQDLRVEDTESHETILVNLKDGMWAVNVKDDVSSSGYPDDVKRALELLPESIQDSLYEEGKRDFWDAAHLLAQREGFERVFQAGRSGGWLCLPGTEDWDPTDIFDYENDSNVKDFLTVAFDAQKLIGSSRDYYFDRVREAMQELQLELSEYAGWVGAEVRTLDGGVVKIAKLDIRYGQAALIGEDGTFSIGREAKLVRKADGTVPSRLTADPIMEQVFQIIEADGQVTREQLDEWLDADDQNDPSALYEKHIGPGVDAIIHDVQRDIAPRFGEIELSPFRKDEDGEWPDDTCYLYELTDGELFEDSEGRLFNRVGYGPVQGSIEIEDDEETHAYLDVVTRIQKHKRSE